jgi:hypothetical protein
MAVTENLSTLTAIAGATIAQFCGVVINGTGKVVVPSLGARIDGVILQAGVLDQPVALAFDGRVTMVAAGTIAIGGNVSATAAGLAQASTSAQIIIGTAIEAAVVNQVFTVQLRRDGTAAP